MDIEQIGEFTNYSFHWVEQLVVNAALKHVDRQRRAGIADTLPIHSALRAVFISEVPHDESLVPVRWIIDEDEYPGTNPDEACPAPQPRVLRDVMSHVSSEIARGDRMATTRPIGRITLTQPLHSNASRRTYREEPIAKLAHEVALFGKIIDRL
jgi:hypothetical protein